MKKIMKLALSFLLMLGMTCSMTTTIAAKEDSSSLIEQLITYYASYQDQAETDILRILDELKAVDPVEAEAWGKIMDYWMYVNRDMTVNQGVAPDGLIKDDSLCFVVLGFALNDDGSMKDELIGRLSVALASAEKYPDSYIACTGGGTAKNNPNATEADQMAQWLIAHGVDADRIIVENKSKNTVQNAQFTYAILRESYPQIASLAMITSDYHVPRGCVLYNSQLLLSAYEANDKLLNIISNAGYDAGHEGYESLALQARGVCDIAGLKELADKISKGELEAPALSVLKELKVTQKDSYQIGENLDLKVMAVYDNGYERDVTSLADFTTFDKEKTGEQIITVSYTENGVTLTSEVTVNVKAEVKEPQDDQKPAVDKENDHKGKVPTADTSTASAWMAALMLSIGAGFICRRKYHA